MFKFLLSLKLSHISSGFIAVIVGYTSSVAIVFQAANAAVADQALINSWLLALGLGMAATCIGLSFYYKTPFSLVCDSTSVSCWRSYSLEYEFIY